MGDGEATGKNVIVADTGEAFVVRDTGGTTWPPAAPGPETPLGAWLARLLARVAAAIADRAG